MADLDLTEAIEAAERAWTTFYPPAPEYDALTVAVRAAAPIIERAVLRVAANDIRRVIVAGARMPDDLTPPGGRRPTTAAYAEWAARIVEDFGSRLEVPDA